MTPEQKRWNNAYSTPKLKPTNLEHLYPDPLNAFEKLQDEKLDRRIKYVSWTISILLVMLSLRQLYLYLEPYFK